MADAPVVHIGQNSPEEVAYKLAHRILVEEKKPFTRAYLLDLFAECFDAVRGGRNWKQK